MLYDTFHDQVPTLEELKHALASYKPVGSFCSILGWIVDENTPVCFKWRSSSPQNLTFGEPVVLGSGMKDFDVKASLLISNLSPIESAIGKTAELLKNEVLYGNNLQKYYGGGFQIIHWTGNKFSFVPSITLIFSRIEETQDIEKYNIIPGERLLKFQQDKEHMSIRALRIENDTVGIGEYPQNNSEYESYDVPSLLNMFTPSVPDTDFTLKSKYYCVCLDIELREQIHVIPNGRLVTIKLNFPIANENSDKWIKVSRDYIDHTETIEISNDFFGEVVKILNSTDRSELVHQLTIRENEEF